MVAVWSHLIGDEDDRGVCARLAALAWHAWGATVSTTDKHAAWAMGTPGQPAMRADNTPECDQAGCVPAIRARSWYRGVLGAAHRRRAMGTGEDLPLAAAIVPTTRHRRLAPTSDGIPDMARPLHTAPLYRHGVDRTRHEGISRNSVPWRPCYVNPGFGAAARHTAPGRLGLVRRNRQPQRFSPALCAFLAKTKSPCSPVVHCVSAPRGAPRPACA